ncbi:MAG: sulfite exporter TauE/SafE family protein [Acidobacteria bacterium]|nr:sulfite exporter TauE/SafE family protein [Acidobacteriota bacterium]
MTLTAVLLGFVIGAALGLLGGGGSILTVPIFVYVLGFPPKDAVAMSLAVVGVTSVVGAFGHYGRGNVDLRTAALFGGAATGGTWAGARLAAYVSGALQLAIFGVVMLAAAVFMFRGRRDVAAAGEQAPRSMPLALVVGEALAVGVLTGLVGVGGGFLIVPALVLLGVSMRTAVGTSLAVIAWNSAVGFSSYLGRAHFAWVPMALVTAGTLPGIWTGTWAHRYVSQDKLRRGFALFLVCIAAFILYQNLPAVLSLGRQK